MLKIEKNTINGMAEFTKEYVIKNTTDLIKAIEDARAERAKDAKRYKAEFIKRWRSGFLGKLLYSKISDEALWKIKTDGSYYMTKEWNEYRRACRDSQSAFSHQYDHCLRLKKLAEESCSDKIYLTEHGADCISRQK